MVSDTEGSVSVVTTGGVPTTGANAANVAGAQKYFDAAQRIATFITTMQPFGPVYVRFVDKANEYLSRAIEFMDASNVKPGDTSARPPIDGESRPK